MKIVILDEYPENHDDLSWDCLKPYGELTIYRETPYDNDIVISRIGDAEIVVTNKVPINKEIIDACPNMKYIAVIATGYNVIDVEYAKQKGIPVSNVPAYGTEAVGQFAIALLLEICNRIGHHSDEVHKGRWSDSGEWCFWDYPIMDLYGKTIGILGFGRIGQVTGRIAKAFGMRVLANDLYENESGRAIAEYVDRETIFKESDVIALHCPLFDDTRGIINKDTIAKMKDGVIIINNGRGPLVVDQDLADALESGKVYAAGLDVMSEEPIRKDNPLLKAPNCFITPHISWASIESRRRILYTTRDNIAAFLEGKPINTVNM